MNLKYVLPCLLFSFPLHGFWWWFGAQQQQEKFSVENCHDMVAKIDSKNYYQMATVINSQGMNVSRFIKEELEQRRDVILQDYVDRGSLRPEGAQHYKDLLQALWIRNKLGIDNNNNIDEIADDIKQLIRQPLPENLEKKAQELKKACHINMPVVFGIDRIDNHWTSHIRGAGKTKFESKVFSYPFDPLSPQFKHFGIIAIGPNQSNALFHATILHENAHLLKSHGLLSGFLECISEDEKLATELDHHDEFEADQYCVRKNVDFARMGEYSRKQSRKMPQSKSHPAGRDRYQVVKRLRKMLEAQQEYYKNIANSDPGRAYDEAWLRACEKQNRREAKEVILAPYKKQLQQRAAAQYAKEQL